jgi:RHS repeat-associated protein
MFAARKRRSPETWGRRYQPVIEALEDRVVPSLLGLAQQGALPDLTSGVLNNLSYSQLGTNTNPFHYDSVPLWLTLPGGSVQYITDPSGGSATTNLDLVLNNTGLFMPGGGNTFSVSGHVTVGAQTYDGTLLTAQPQAFGAGNAIASGQGEFEVQLQITGGQLAAPSNAPANPFRVGDTLGLLIHQPGLPITSFPQTFSFSSQASGTFDGTSDAENIPAIPRSKLIGATCPCANQPGNLSKTNPANGGNVPSNKSQANVDYSDGEVQVATTDLSSDGYGTSWGQTRSWTNGPGYAARADNGNGVVDTQTPYLLAVNGVNTMAEIANGGTAEYFDLVGATYQPRFFSQDTLRYDSAGHQFVLSDTTGDQLTFYDFSSSFPIAQQGQFQSFTDPGGNVTAVTAHTASGQIGSVQRSTTTGSNTVTETYLYSYVPSGVNTGLLQNVTLERQNNGGPQDVVRQVVYTYYDGSQSYGNPGDLMLAVVQTASGNAIDTSYYRYYTEADAGTTGYIHGLKYAYDTNSYARLVTAVGNPQTATDAQVAPYAANYFQYDDQQRVTEAVVQGEGCSSCTGGLGTYTYSYTLSNNPAGFNSWAVKTVETLPDGNQNVMYSNAYGEQMLGVFANQTTGQQWETFYQYDGQGRVIKMANPSAVTGYDDSHADLLNNQGGNYQYLSDHTGLITRYDYDSSTTATESTPGSVTGYQFDTQLQQGQLGTQIPQRTYQYYTHTGGGVTIHPWATDTKYRNDNGTGAETTTYSYTYFAGTTQIQSMTTTLPAISALQNGPGIADVDTSVYDLYGRVIWSRNSINPTSGMADGYISYTAYDPGTGAVVESITDVNTADPSDFSNLPPGWSTPPGGGLNLVTRYQVDNLGRTTGATDPNGNVTYTVYDDPAHEMRVYPGWNSGTGRPTGPTEVYRYDLPGSYRETLTMSAAPHLTGGVPDGTEPITNMQTLHRDYTNAAGQYVRMDMYYDLTGLTYSTAPFIGAQNTNYYTTQSSYDHRGRLEKTVTPTGTITRTVYDGLGRVVSNWVGTNDTPASGFWSPDNNTPPANMVEVKADVYDNGGVGDSNLTAETDFPGGGAAPRVSRYFYDWRDRLVAGKGGVEASENDGTHRPIIYYNYDNLNEVISRSQYDGDGVTITSSNGVPNAPPANLLRAYSTTSYDDQGRAFQSNVYSVDPSNGTVSANSLITRNFYDHRGNAIERSDPGGLVTKMRYDGADRPGVTYSTDGGSGSDWNATNTVSGDIVLEQVETSYDANGNVIETTNRQRFDDATATGALGTPTSGTHARDYFTATYYDASDRVVAQVDVGTNGGTAYVRPASPPARSDSVLVTSYEYNGAGWVEDTVDPRGIDTRTEYDGLGRTTRTIQNYTDGVPTNSSNRTTAYTYDGDDNRLTVTGVLPSGTPSETTEYVYGVSTATGSAINSNDLLAATIYPDPATGQPSTDPSQHESYAYNALGQITSVIDRNGTTHAYRYDTLGRRKSDSVTIAIGNPNNVDTTVLRLDTAYDSQGNAYLFTSYADTVDPSPIVNQVERTFNGLGQLVSEYQSHAGPVDHATTPQVQYSYNLMAGGTNNSRLVSMTYPNGRVLNYNYNAGLDNSISRLSSISDNSATLESYTYLGLSTVVQRSHPQTGINLTYISPTGSTGDAGDKYTGLDRFGRIVEQAWQNSSASVVTDDFKYGYDRNGNALYRINMLNAAFDELYHANGPSNGYDGYNQIVAFARGVLNSTNDTISNPSRTQTYNYDAIGNPGPANAQNELTISIYDNNGNMTTDETGQHYVWDAWNRLVAVRASNGPPTASYAFDGLGRRIQETISGATTDLYFDGARIVEERLAGSSHANFQYVWDPLATNTLVERDSVPDAMGHLTVRLYYQVDANNNVTALVGFTSGWQVVERYVYDPFGGVTIYDPTWIVVRSTSAYANNWLFQDGRFDATTGNAIFENRIYRPSLQTWLSIDPIGFAGGTVDLYQMEGNNPVNGTDPSGLGTTVYSKVSWEISVRSWFSSSWYWAGDTVVNTELDVDKTSVDYVSSNPDVSPTNSYKNRWAVNFGHNLYFAASGYGKEIKCPCLDKNGNPTGQKTWKGVFVYHLHAMREDSKVEIDKITAGVEAKAGKKDVAEISAKVEVELKVKNPEETSTRWFKADICPDGKGGIIISGKDTNEASRDNHYGRNHNGITQGTGKASGHKK